MRVKLVSYSESDIFRGFTYRQSQSDCDCNCACPTGEGFVPTLDFPVAFYLELTPLCNNRCLGCGNVYATERFLSSSSLTRTEWRTLIAQFAPHIHHVKLTGGEPTLHPDFEDIVAALDEHSVSFTVFTNARWVDPDDVLKVLRSTRMCDGLLVSLHGPDPATHEKFSGVSGSFSETVLNIRRAVEAGLDVATSLVITRYNWDQIERTLALALDLGANHVVYNRWIGKPQLNLAPKTTQLRAAIRTVESLRSRGQSIRFGNCIPQCFAASSATGCTAGTTFATIDPWGRVRPCNHASIIAGDLHTQTLQEIWHGEVMTHWRNLVPLECVDCPSFTICHGGCRAQALLADTKQDPLIQAPFPPPRGETELYLWAGLRPVARFAQREERGQLLLCYKSQVVTVPSGLQSLLPHIDGSLTLQKIRENYGSRAVDWVGTLVQAGLVTWA